jgi:hypothetical protein
MVVSNVNNNAKHCIYIKNLFTKHSLKCNATVYDIYEFFYKMFENQPMNALFLYEFDNGEKYITAHNHKNFIIEPIEDEIMLKIIENICDPDYNNKEKKINSLADKIISFANTHNLKFNNIDRDKLIDFIRNLENNPLKKSIDDAKEAYIQEIENKQQNNKKIWKTNQQGGVLIWAFEKYLFPKMPNMVRTILWTILEIVDVVLIIGSSIPGLQGVLLAGFIFDIINIVYCFLRFDIVGLMGAIVSIIPIVGDVIGGGIRVLSKIYTYYNKFKRGVAKADNLLTITRESFNTAGDVITGNITPQTFSRVANVLPQTLTGRRGRRIGKIINTANMVVPQKITYQQSPEELNLQQQLEFLKTR